MKKNLHSFLAIIILLLSAKTHIAQTQNSSGILYTYDEAGNRKRREIAPQQQGRNAAPGTETKKETAVVSKNNLQASFTPNPTFTGNFTVVVNRSDFASTDKNTNDKKSVGELVHPQIFIYNPLGELIHQESATFNSPVFINLSKEAKGIYIVKVQSGDEVLMHRLAYQ